MQVTAVPVSVIADTIVRTVELGVTITDAALDGLEQVDTMDGAAARAAELASAAA